MPKRLLMATVAALALASCGQESAPIQIIGSSTVYPFTKAVADQYVQENPGAVPPRITETGTVSGISDFCSGAGAPDVLDASRRITRKEFEKCTANGVGEVMEIAIGLDGIALAESNDGPKISVTTTDLYRALAANPMGKPNTAKTWADVNPKLPAIPIKVFGPPKTSGTRDSFVTLILEPGCLEAMPDANKLRQGGDPAKFAQTCLTLREDGAYEPAGEDHNAIVKALDGNKNALGLFGYSYLEQNAGRLHGIAINGTAPDADTIARGTYKGVRPLYLYVKKGRLASHPALQGFLDQYAKMWQPGGPLVKRGLVAMPDKMRATSAETIKSGFALSPDDLY